MNKVWPDGEADLPDVIRVRLYQKDSKTASASTAIEVDSAEISRGEDGTWSYTFSRLDPEKAYFIREDPVDGYTATYSSNNMLGLEKSGTITVTNTKDEPDDETASVIVKKKWMQGEEEITDIQQKKDLSATVELVRYREEQSKAKLYIVHYGDSNTEDWRKEATVPISTDVALTINCAKAYQGVIIDQYYQYAYNIGGGTSVAANDGDSPKTYHINTSNGNDVYLCLRYCGGVAKDDVSVSSESVGASGGTGGVVELDQDFTGTTIALNRENGWRASFSDLPTTGTVSGKNYNYTYGIRETGTSDSGFAFEAYSVGTYDGEGSNNATVAVTSGSTVTVTNKKQTTDIEFEKQWIDTGQQEIEWDQDIQLTVSRNKADGNKDSSFSLVYAVTKSEVSSTTGGDAEFSTGTEADPKLKLTITTEGGKKKYNFKIENLAYSGETDGKYTYYVEETNAQLVGYLAPSYTNTSAPTGGTAAYDNGIIINKQEGGVELPSTGGPGTTWIYLLGAILLLGCGVTLIVRRRMATMESKQS